MAARLVAWARDAEWQRERSSTRRSDRARACRSAVAVWGTGIGIGIGGSMNVCVLAITKGTLNSVMGEASGYSGRSVESGLSREVELSWACAMLSAAVPVPVLVH